MHGYWLRFIWHSLSRRFRRSAITFAGVAFSVAALVFLHAIMVGVGDTMIRSSVTIHSGHIRLSGPGNVSLGDIRGQVSDLPDVDRALLRRTWQGILQRDQLRSSVALYAVTADDERDQTVIAKRLAAGTYLAAPGSIVLGQRLADSLGVSVDDTVSFLTAAGEECSYQVGGIFHTTIEWLDERAAFVAAPDAPVTTPPDAVEAAIFLHPGAPLDRAADAVRRSAPPGAAVRTWRDLIPEVVQLVSLNGVSMGILLLLASLILAFGVSNTVFLSVADRIGEFGVLKTVGLTPRAVSLLVVAETLLLVLSAGALGLAIGFGASWAFGVSGIDLSAWTSENRHFVASGIVYPRVTAVGLLLPVGVALACGVFASLFPARRAGRANVAEALRSL